MTVLADTSVWVDHLRRGNPVLARLLGEGLVLAHTAVLGELACGTLRRRAEFLSLMKALPSAREAHPEEMLEMIEARKLWGRGLGWIDVQLIAASLLTPCELWTLDVPLRKAAREIGVAYGGP